MQLVTHKSMLYRALLVAAVCSVFAAGAAAQDVPLISGAVGSQSNVTAGSASTGLAVDPVLAAPLGQHLLVESRADLRQSWIQTPAEWMGSYIASLTYAQLDIVVNKHLTIVGGEFLTPFNTYNERLSAMWVPRLPEAPLTFYIGQPFDSDGGMVRGTLVSGAKVQLNYNAYVSGASSMKQFQSGRTAGGQAAVFLPHAGLEVGSSYQRHRQQTHFNNFGAHVWWIPPGGRFQLRSEYAHGYASQGYWVETVYRLSRFGGANSFVGRMEPVFRMQQSFRNRPNISHEGDSLPAADTQEADFGFSYHLPHEVRLNASYARQFSTKNKNLWDINLTYRFLFPAWPGRRSHL